MACTLLGMGNPLLDIASPVDAATLEKYGLKTGDVILAEEKHLPLYAELTAKPTVEYIAGGATQNTIRVAQWISQTAGATGYMGCTGSDDFAKKMSDSCKADGVHTSYMVDSTTPTGLCGVCIVDKERTLVTNLLAANNFKIAHVEKAENWAMVESAKIVYSAGFFLTVSPDSMMKVAAHCNEAGKTYCLNLSAPFLMEVPPFKAAMTALMPHVDIIFGNETEAACFAKTEGWTETCVKAIAAKIQALPKKTDKARMVVITHGKDPTIVATADGVKEFPIITLAADAIVDTNGAGDSFVGGFLAAMVKGHSADLTKCCQAGAFAACEVIQRSSCTFDSTKVPDFL